METAVLQFFYNSTTVNCFCCYLGKGERRILKCTLKWNERVWTGLMWLRIWSYELDVEVPAP